MANYNKLLTLVQEHLESLETIKASIFGAYECERLGAKTVRNGIMVATEKRVLFYSKKLIGYESESFPLASISSLESGKGLLGHKISFFSSNNKVSLKWISQGQIKEFFEYVRDSIGSKPSNTSSVSQDIPSQIKKLSELKEQGILTEDEFTTKKKELLAKM